MYMYIVSGETSLVYANQRLLHAQLMQYLSEHKKTVHVNDVLQSFRVIVYSSSSLRLEPSARYEKEKSE